MPSSNPAQVLVVAASAVGLISVILAAVAVSSIAMGSVYQVPVNQTPFYGAATYNGYVTFTTGLSMWYASSITASNGFRKSTPLSTQQTRWSDLSTQTACAGDDVQQLWSDPLGLCVAQHDGSSAYQVPPQVATMQACSLVGLFVCAAAAIVGMCAAAVPADDARAQLKLGVTSLVLFLAAAVLSIFGFLYWFSWGQISRYSVFWSAPGVLSLSQSPAEFSMQMGAYLEILVTTLCFVCAALVFFGLLCVDAKAADVCSWMCLCVPKRGEVRTDEREEEKQRLL
jgi:hypothetical protein